MSGNNSGCDTTLAILNKLPRIENVKMLDYEGFDSSSVKHYADGSNSNIFKATHKALGKQTVIIKVMQRSPGCINLTLKEFSVEDGTLSRLSHPNIVRFYGGGQLSAVRPFLVLENLAGGSLMTCLAPDANGSPFTLRKFLEIAKQLASALKYLHNDFDENVTIIHRDLKPENVGFTEDGILKLMDFGLSAAIPKSSNLNEYYELTGSTGSLRYMAPEVAKEFPYNHKVDIYSYGIILWQIATGLMPFDNMSREDFYQDVVFGIKRPDVSIDPSKTCHLQPEIIELMRRCWDANPSLRPSAHEIHDQLTKILLGMPPPLSKRNSLSRSFSMAIKSMVLK